MEATAEIFFDSKTLPPFPVLPNEPSELAGSSGIADQRAECKIAAAFLIKFGTTTPTSFGCVLLLSRFEGWQDFPRILRPFRAGLTIAMAIGQHCVASRNRQSSQLYPVGCLAAACSRELSRNCDSTRTADRGAGVWLPGLGRGRFRRSIRKPLPEAKVPATGTAANEGVVNKGPLFNKFEPMSTGPRFPSARP